LSCPLFFARISEEEEEDDDEEDESDIRSPEIDSSFKNSI